MTKLLRVLPSFLIQNEEGEDHLNLLLYRPFQDDYRQIKLKLPDYEGQVVMLSNTKLILTLCSKEVFLPRCTCCYDLITGKLIRLKYLGSVVRIQASSSDNETSKFYVGNKVSDDLIRFKLIQINKKKLKNFRIINELPSTLLSTQKFKIISLGPNWLILQGSFTNFYYRSGVNQEYEWKEISSMDSFCNFGNGNILCFDFDGTPANNFGNYQSCKFSEDGKIIRSQLGSIEVKNPIGTQIASNIFVIAGSDREPKKKVIIKTYDKDVHLPLKNYQILEYDESFLKVFPLDEFNFLIVFMEKVEIWTRSSDSYSYSLNIIIPVHLDFSDLQINPLFSFCKSIEIALNHLKNLITCLSTDLLREMIEFL